MADDNLVFELSRFIQRISAIARTGLAFAPPSFDTERYDELLVEAARITAALEGADDEARESLYRRWRDDVGAG